MRVVRLVGDTVKNCRCQRTTLRPQQCSVKVGHNVVRNCSSKQLAVRCCHPNWGSALSTYRSLVGVGEDPPRGHVQPCFTEVSAQSLTAWKQGATSWSIPDNMISATSGCHRPNWTNGLPLWTLQRN